MPHLFHRTLRPVRTLLGLLLRRPLVGTCIIPLLPDSRIVLIRRRDNGLWGLPGGMVDWGETIVTAAERELKEETGLQLLSVGRLVGIYSHAERDPRFHSICVVLELYVDGAFHILDTDEVADIQAFHPQELMTQKLSHDHQSQLKDYFAGKTVIS